MTSMKLRMYTPLPQYMDEVGQATLAPRPATLDGLRLGLLPNWRPSAVHILKALGELLEERFQFKEVVFEQPLLENPPNDQGKLVDVMRDHLDGFASRVDIAITATGD